MILGLAVVIVPFALGLVIGVRYQLWAGILGLPVGFLGVVLFLNGAFDKGPGSMGRFYQELYMDAGMALFLLGTIAFFTAVVFLGYSHLRTLLRLDWKSG